LLHDFDETYEPDCVCKTKGEFIKNAFNYEKPMSSYLKKKYSKTTKLLLSISTTYLILHSPLALSKIYYFLKNHAIYSPNFEAQESFPQSTISINLEFISNSTLDLEKLNTTYFFNMSTDMEINLAEEIIERIGGYLYYLNFPLNFFLYTLNGKKFRDGIKNMFKRKHLLNRRCCIRV
jgi:hypothetical protein